MSQNKYIFNILDFFYKKIKTKILYKNLKILKNDCDEWDANQKPVSQSPNQKPTVSRMLWPLAQQEWDKK